MCNLYLINSIFFAGCLKTAKKQENGGNTDKTQNVCKNTPLRLMVWLPAKVLATQNAEGIAAENLCTLIIRVTIVKMESDLVFNNNNNNNDNTNRTFSVASFCVFLKLFCAHILWRKMSSLLELPFGQSFLIYWQRMSSVNTPRNAPECVPHVSVTRTFLFVSPSASLLPRNNPLLRQ